MAASLPLFFPVPPLAIATIPVTLAAVPEQLPVTLPVTLPVKLPAKLVAVNLPAVVSKYTPVSANAVTPVAVDVGVVEVPNKYAFVVVAKVTLTLVSVLVSVGTAHVASARKNLA